MKYLIVISTLFILFSSCKKDPAQPLTEVCDINTVSETTINVNKTDYKFDQHHIFEYNDLISINFLNNHLVNDVEVIESFLFFNIKPRVGKYFLIENPVDGVTPGAGYSVLDIDVPTDASYPVLIDDNWIEITKICDDGIIGEASLKLVRKDPSTPYGFYGNVDTLNVKFEFAIKR